MSEFASEFGWQPSDYIISGPLSNRTNGHLLVEHGLENTAAITFLRHPLQYEDLDRYEKLQLLQLSYNNLVDWHIQVHSTSVAYVFNRTPPPGIVQTRRLARDDTDPLLSEAFLALSARPPRPSFPAVDEALVEAISYWKRRLAAELNYTIENRCLSKLFNLLILVRAIEDQVRSANAHQDSAAPYTQILLREWERGKHSNLRSLIEACLKQVSGVDGIPTFDPAEISGFDGLSSRTVSSLLSDFYRDRRVPYWYDFSLMSKHALSRIYEHYVSLLTIEDSDQLALFPQLPEEERNRAFGSIYTPEFVARFFAKYAIKELLEEWMPTTRILDPACGSGIFLRVFLELSSQMLNGNREVKQAISRATGIDYDENACQAARLSLSLLQLALTGELPQELNVIRAESFGHFEEHPELHSAFEVVMMNPPFLSLGRLEPSMRQRALDYLGPLKRGRIDAYLPFLKLAVEALRPGGYAFVVVPHSFLLADNAAKVRGFLAEACEIICVADLSSIRIFGKTGSYIVLLVLRKRLGPVPSSRPVTIVQCQDLPSRALQDALEGRWRTTPSYSVYQGSQKLFTGKRWLLIPPGESAIRRRFENFPRLKDFLEIHQGIVSGADEFFDLPAKDVPPEELALYAPYLPDRQMQPYLLPSQTGRVFFFPFLGGEKVSEATIKAEFRWTWQHLSRHRKKLKARAGLAKYNKAWWEPLWPRTPKSILRPKIVTPHLTLTPRFSLDREGRYVISRSPFFHPPEGSTTDEMGILYYFLGILNSTACFWSISLISHTYRGNYVMLECKTLLETPVPDPDSVDPDFVRRMIVLVKKRIDSGDSAKTTEAEIDALASDLYGLSNSDLEALGLPPRK